MSRTLNTILAFVSGAAIGAGAGLLFAPEKGEDTRRKIGEEAVKAKEKVKQQWESTASGISDKTKRTLSDFEVSMDRTMEAATERANELILGLQGRLDDLHARIEKLQEEKWGDDAKSSKKTSKA